MILPTRNASRRRPLRAHAPSPAGGVGDLCSPPRHFTVFGHARTGAQTSRTGAHEAGSGGHGGAGTARALGQRAFTLIELLLVLVILGILAAIVVPKFSGRTEQARETAARSQLATFGTALDAFEVDNGYYPKGRDGLQDLVVQPRDAKNWRGPYLKSDVPLDPWGNAYIYECPGRYNPSGYDLMSMGPDGREGGDDDIGNWLRTDQRRR
ncbi:MAG: type II secretion system major pseudopilin GspG [Verrucomicrobia bacterium]|jgi:general secretion pathway protein G|nr:type II secretion system major pseudopilin GspG [Verrucomicrobiota bacterium]OQC64012.1 MAG: Type II secretion system protein G precursor [Verrucomicrobia bacterium ADurb.Bin006]MDI9380546.1 type II secretion system major pseudopilin GspG [Verrucomicrobiota bacterium]NMD19197.1 type II secretion system major pseudopilin GspG [Verrucomicrobiota bacterium]HNU99475.1 type II secretion system major pseudopilin GspG [Verrucomicrobiota bacterium]